MTTDIEKKQGPVMTLEWNAIRRMFANPRYQQALTNTAAMTKNCVVLPEDAVKAVLATVLINPYLAEVHELSLLYGAMMSIRTGLPLGQPLDLAYLVPRYNHTLKSQWAYFTPSYRGKLTIAYRQPQVAAVGGEAVRANDHYILVNGPFPRVEHSRNDGERGEVVAAYAYAWLVGAPQPVVAELDAEGLEKRRRMSKGSYDKQGNPRPEAAWFKWPEEMAAGKALAKLCKRLPAAPEMGFALQAEDRYDGGETEEAIRASDTEMVRAFEDEIGEALLPASTSVSVDVTERVKEMVDAKPTARVEAVPPFDGKWNDGVGGVLSQPVEAEAPRTNISIDEAREIAAAAANVYHGTVQVDEWRTGLLERLAYDRNGSVRQLAPAEFRAEMARLKSEASAGIKGTK